MSHRPAIVASVIRTLIAKAAQEIPPDIAVVVSITSVEVSADFSYATINVSALQHADRAIRFLQKRKAALRHSIAGELRMYKVPELRFVIDEREKRASRIDRILSGEQVDDEPNVS